MTNDKFKVNSFSIQDLIERNDKYVIPAFQRPYQWQDTHVSMLFRDLIDHFRLKKEYNYSIGSIVCVINNGVFQILDGQQRLTTLDLLLNEITNKLKSDFQYNSPNRVRIISAYQYLRGKSASKITELPYCKKQKEIIIRHLSEINDKDELLAFYRCILEKVYVQRVCIPIVRSVKNESSKIFEIINISGQKLSVTDILKARFLSLIPGENTEERELFNDMWSRFDEDLINKTTYPNNRAQNKKSYSGQWYPNTSLSIGEICSKSKTNRNSDLPNNNENEKQNTNLISPIDFSNALVISEILLRKWKYGCLNECNEKIDDYNALSEKKLVKRFHWILDEKSKSIASKDAWKLLSVMKIVTQTIVNWGVYRTNDMNPPEDQNYFNQLVLSFMASNSYQYSAQYWYLLLSAIVLKSTMPTYEDIPCDFNSFKKQSNLKLNEELQKSAYLKLIALGYQYAQSGATNATNEVFTILNLNLPKELSSLQSQLNENNWKFNNWGHFTHWNLYFLDYLLWCDKERNFKQLKNVINIFISHTYDDVVITALKSFNWAQYKTKADSLKIVSRGAIEHWLSQEKAKFHSIQNSKEDELLLRHGFGNLALIDSSANSSLRDDELSGKSEKVLNMTNPSMKLLWLAFFSQNINGNLTGGNIPILTSIFGKYIKEYHF